MATRVPYKTLEVMDSTPGSGGTFINDQIKAIADQLELKSPIASPTFTGTLTVPNITLEDGTLAIGAGSLTTLGVSASATLTEGSLTCQTLNNYYQTTYSASSLKLQFSVDSHLTVIDESGIFLKQYFDSDPNTAANLSYIKYDGTAKITNSLVIGGPGSGDIVHLNVKGDEEQNNAVQTWSDFEDSPIASVYNDGGIECTSIISTRIYSTRDGGGSNNFNIDLGTGNLTITAGYVILPLPTSQLSFASLSNSQLTFSANESGDNLVIQVKYSNGTTKTASISLN